ncbi:MAG: hypothetical protein K2M10_05965, partial [Muribaculaceae bacterium]|nr:hypothetical protein [Muribaculaceae bacterium]
PSWALPSLGESEATKLPHIKVVASPSNAAQVKIAGNLLSELRGRITAGEINGAKVAVILPDENLLLPMLYSLPAGMGEVNLTMGYPLRLTSVVPFVTLLRRLHFNVRIEKGDYCIYHRDLRQLFAHPFSHLLFGSIKIQSILDILNNQHRSTISVAELRGISQEMGDVLDPTRLGEKPQEVVEYIRYVLNKIKEKLPQEESVGIKSRLDEDHIEIYLRALQRLSDLLDEYAINMRQATVFRLVDRILAGETVGFKGEPLTGLQVMGSLETRSIDFEHLFVLSMNEKIMPMRARRRTFIPDSLRHAYGMPPSNYAESIFAYYFYRMISRAKEVTLLYDARNSGGISSGDVSRYIVQLRELFAKGEIEEEEWNFKLTGKTES